MKWRKVYLECQEGGDSSVLITSMYALLSYIIIYMEYHTPLYEHTSFMCLDSEYLTSNRELAKLIYMTKRIL